MEDLSVNLWNSSRQPLLEKKYTSDESLQVRSNDSSAVHTFAVMNVAISRRTSLYDCKHSLTYWSEVKRDYSLTRLDWSELKRDNWQEIHMSTNFCIVWISPTMALKTNEAWVSVVDSQRKPTKSSTSPRQKGHNVVNWLGRNDLGRRNQYNNRQAKKKCMKRFWLKISSGRSRRRQKKAQQSLLTFAISYI